MSEIKQIETCHRCEAGASKYSCGICGKPIPPYIIDLSWDEIELP